MNKHTEAKRVILILVPDLMFQSRVREQAGALGYDTTVADSIDDVEMALAGAPALVVLDLHAHGFDWRQAVALAKEQGAPVLAFGRHTEVELLRSAREAGCDRVVPRSVLVEEMPQLIREYARA